MKTVVIARYKMNLADRKEEFTGKEAAFSLSCSTYDRAKERACPCANTDKLKERIETLLTPEYNTDPEWLQYAGVLYYAVDDRGRKFQASTVLRLSDPQLGKLIHWLHYHLKGSNPPPALYHLEMLLQSLEYLRGGRHYLYNSIHEIASGGVPMKWRPNLPRSDITSTLAE